MAKAIFHSPPTGNIEMLLFIILALLVIPTKSLIPLAATDADFTCDAAVAIAGLLSYIGLFGYVFWPQRTTGKSLDRSPRGASVEARPSRCRLAAEARDIDDRPASLRTQDRQHGLDHRHGAKEVRQAQPSPAPEDRMT
jgi:hypothetical protein